MREFFEVKPILVAAAIGAVALVIINLFYEEPSPWSALATGAVVGATVQIGVRVFGVS
jgi:hypothetical protein